MAASARIHQNHSAPSELQPSSNQESLRPIRIATILQSRITPPHQNCNHPPIKKDSAPSELQPSSNQESLRPISTATLHQSRITPLHQNCNHPPIKKDSAPSLLQPLSNIEHTAQTLIQAVFNILNLLFRLHLVVLRRCW